MKTLKLFLVAIALTMTSATYANSADGGKSSKVTLEIQKMLGESNLVIKEEFTLTVLFSINSEMKIQIRSISSPDETVNEFLRSRLEGRQLTGSVWSTGKVYSLPVKVAGKR